MPQYLILDMPVGDLIANRSTFVDIMVTNLSLPRDDLELFLNSTLDAEKVIIKQIHLIYKHFCFFLDALGKFKIWSKK